MLDSGLGGADGVRLSFDEGWELIEVDSMVGYGLGIDISKKRPNYDTIEEDNRGKKLMMVPIRVLRSTAHTKTS